MSASRKKFTVSASHQIVHRVDKYHIALAFLALGVRRHQQMDLPVDRDPGHPEGHEAYTPAAPPTN